MVYKLNISCKVLQLLKTFSKPNFLAVLLIQFYTYQIKIPVVNELLITFIIRFTIISTNSFNNNMESGSRIEDLFQQDILIF